MMFNMNHTGTKLAQARKAKDMTQLELADRLGISFQAVSNWERGTSMPDISKLPEISELLGVSIDELLGKEAPLVKSVIENKTAEYLSKNEVTVAEAVEAAPLLRPSQTDEIAGELSKRCRPDELEEIYPFLGRDMCDELFNKAVDAKDYRSLDSLAPFVSREVMNETLLKNIGGGFPVGDLACFADRKIVGKLALKIIREKGICGSFDELAPFIDKEDLSAIADEEFERSGLKHFEHIAPFMDKEKLRTLARVAIDRDGIKAISPIAPFLGREFLAGYVRDRYL